MITVITPTHDPKWLPEAAKSLEAQDYGGKFEWLVVPNNGCEVEGLPKFARVVPYPGPSGNVGAMKAYACQLASGEKIVELDHDDLLTPTALSRIDAALDEADFCYSDFARFNDGNWEPWYWPTDSGWRYRDEEYYGHKVAVTEAFPPTAHAYSRIEWAPNHVRAWRKDRYFEIGGHDPALKVADDYDLCCQFYLRGKVAYIPECLYLYRVHPENISQVQNRDVQETMMGLRNGYLHPLVERWADLNELPKVNICCGGDVRAGWVNVDRAGSTGDGITVADLEFRWPWPDSSVGVIMANDALEHLRDPLHTMQEIYRVLVPGGWLLSATPSTDGRGAFQDPTHRSFWNENSFWYYTRADQGAFIGTPVRFQAVRLWTGYANEWQGQNRIPYVFADLVALKDGYRAPGVQEI